MKAEQANSILSLFLSKSYELREYLKKPFVIDGRVGATNGHIMAFLDVADGIEAQPESELPTAFIKSVRSLASKAKDFLRDGSFYKIPELPALKICQACKGQKVAFFEDCEECDGEGEFLHGNNWYTCKECDGEGQLRAAGRNGNSKECLDCEGTGNDINVGYELTGGNYGLHYLHLLQSIEAELGVSVNETEPTAFRFDGGSGLIMQRRRNS